MYEKGKKGKIGGDDQILRGWGEEAGLFVVSDESSGTLS